MRSNVTCACVQSRHANNRAHEKATKTRIHTQIHFHMHVFLVFFVAAAAYSASQGECPYSAETSRRLNQTKYAQSIENLTNGIDKMIFETRRDLEEEKNVVFVYLRIVALDKGVDVLHYLVLV